MVGHLGALHLLNANGEKLNELLGSSRDSYFLGALFLFLEIAMIIYL